MKTLQMKDQKGIMELTHFSCVAVKTPFIRQECHKLVDQRQLKSAKISGHLQ